jgi:hypothetical protein
VNLRNPLVSLAFAMTHATETGLNGVPSTEATSLLGATPQGPRRRRPLPGECDVVMFSQCWSDREVGFAHQVEGRVHDGQVVIVMGPQGDACVYFGPQHVYRVSQPNRRFFLDVAAQRLEGVQGARAYEGRDDEIVESVEYRVEMELSRLEGLARREPRKAAAMAKLLSQYAGRFARLADDGWLAREPASGVACEG